MGVGAELRRQSGAPFIAGGTDVAAGNLVKVAGPGWSVQNVTAVTDEPFGVARASAPSGQAVDVRDVPSGDIVRGIAAATIAVGNLVGFASNAATAGASGNIQITQYVAVSKAASLSTATWSAGVAVEAANPGNSFAFRVNPRQVSGLS